MNNQEIKVYKNLQGLNDKWAAETRRLLADAGLIMLNLISSPGAGKTTLLEKMAKALVGRMRFAVLEGDLETTRDAARLQALKIPTCQLITGSGCHLNAKMVHHALRDLPLHELDLVIVENVGNLVCPAQFDIGESAKIALLSVTEGEDKPLKYPLLFREAKAVVLTKIDLLPHLSFDLEECLKYLKQINGSIPIFQLSNVTGRGLDAWVNWLLQLCASRP